MEPVIGDRKRVRNDKRSTETRNIDGREPTSQARHRGGNYQYQKSRRSVRIAHGPSLLDFAPDLMSQLNSPPSSQSTENRNPATGGRYSSEESPFRSPLHKSRRGLQETTPYRGRHGPHNRGSHSFRQKATRMRSSPDMMTPYQENSESSQSGERRVRKCLWANEVDEAFFEGDMGVGSVVANEAPKTPTKDQMARRQKDIDFGKATDGYKNYLERMPREQRRNMCPITPDKNAKVPRRVWDASVRKWRKALHGWDAPLRPSPSSTPFSSSSKIQTKLVGKKTPSGSKRDGLSTPSSATSSLSDRGYSTTPDSRADCSSLDLEEEEDFFMGEMDFPPLSSGGERKQWWEMMKEAEEEAELREEAATQLDHIVKKLRIGTTDNSEEALVAEEGNRNEEEKADQIRN